MPRRNTSGHGRPGRNRSSRSRAELARLEHLERVESAEIVPLAPRGRVRPTPPGLSRCLNGKIGYASEGKALEALARIAAENTPRRDKPVRVYLCDKCPGWHLTARPFPPRPRGEE